MNFVGMRVLVFGAGESGISAALTLSEQGAVVTLVDGKPLAQLKQKALLEKLTGKVRLLTGIQEEALLEDQQLMIISPGIPLEHPLPQAALKRNLPLWGEVELAGRLSRAPILAVTGTNGKTTTTTLLAEMIRTRYREVSVGGNIGEGLARSVTAIEPDGYVVAEISSFQLERSETFHPHIAVILNLTPDHLDRHGNLEQYGAVKEKIFANQIAEDYLVLNCDDERVWNMRSRSRAQIVGFSRNRAPECGAYLEHQCLMLRDQDQSWPICRIGEMKLFGGHNVENALAACAAAYCAGVGIEAMAEVLKSFSGVEHRIEPVGVIDEVAYYNDSKATNPESTVKALEAFSGGVVLIAGGRDKNTDLAEFFRLVQEKVVWLILLGEAADRFEAAGRANGFERMVRVDSLEQAVEQAGRLAAPFQVVLLSPACASYDMFDNYEQRGQTFKDLVRKAGRLA